MMSALLVPCSCREVQIDVSVRPNHLSDCSLKGDGGRVFLRGRDHPYRKDSHAPTKFLGRCGAQAPLLFRGSGVCRPSNSPSILAFGGNQLLTDLIEARLALTTELTD